MPRTEFTSYEDFIGNYSVRAPDDFNFGFDVVDAWADIDPDKLALWWIDDGGANEKIFTFGEMKRLSNRAANYFTGLGVGKGDFVMLILRQRYEYWICAAALHKIGAVLIPAASQLTRKDIVYRNNAAGISAIVALASETRLLEEIRLSLADSPTVRHVVSAGGGGGQPCGFPDFEEGIAGCSDVFERPAGDGATRIDDRFLMYFTSGTTGMPKMVMHDYAYPFGHIATAKYWQRACEGALHLTIADSGWAKFGWGKIYGQWLCGAAIFSHDFERFAPIRTLEVLQKYPITTFCAPPTMYRFMIQENVRAYDLSSIKFFTTAGEPLNPEVFNQWKSLTGLGIFEGFGQTESAVLLANFEWFEPKPGSTGKPSPLYDIKIVDDGYRQCEEGIEGRIVVRGTDKYMPPGLIKYYHGDAALNAEAFRGGCYNTGDIAWMDSDGHYWFVGRNDDIIKSSGYRIGPFEVESALVEHEAVVECAVTAVPDAVRGQIVKATVVLAKGFTAGEALVKELQNHVKRVTAPYKYPRIIEFTDELPKTIGGGKIKRAEIRSRDSR